MLPGENERDRVLNGVEESRYLTPPPLSAKAFWLRTRELSTAFELSYGARSRQDPATRSCCGDVTTILLDCGLRPEEAFRLRWQHVQDEVLYIPYGKTENARRRIPLTQRAGALLSMRRCAHSEEWVFPAPTRTGHIEKSCLKKQH